MVATYASLLLLVSTHHSRSDFRPNNITSWMKVMKPRRGRPCLGTNTGMEKLGPAFIAGAY